MTDRDHGGRRQFVPEEMVKLSLRSFVERGGRFIEEQILWRVQQRAGEPKALLLAQRQHPVPVRLLLQLRRELRQAYRDQNLADPSRPELYGFLAIDDIH